MSLFGCDTFVVLPPLTANGDVIFGKNSDRPQGEVQEVLFQPSKSFLAGSKQKCTYIEVDQVVSTYAVLLSKPSWMWGAEMGANACGVVIGNEAVWTVIDDDIQTERLLGMDLVRLGLERSSSSSEAVRIITTLLEMYGQGGPCSDTDHSLLYHNSFLIADPKEAWVLETAGKLWAAEKVTSGHRNISNCLSIGSNITAKSNQLLSFAKEQKLWKGDKEFSFKDVFSCGGCPREAAGHKLLENLTTDKRFDIEQMFKILRNKHSSICRSFDGPFHTSASWVSSLSIIGLGKSSCHWITATPDPSVSVFKPFVFSPSSITPSQVISPRFENDPAKAEPRFQFKVDRRHTLYKLHEVSYKNQSVVNKLKAVEKKLVDDTSNLLKNIEKGSEDIKCCDNLLESAISAEISVYST